MILIKPSFEILYISNMALEMIELAGRTCYKSEEKITPFSAKDFVQMLKDRKHDAMLEFGYITVRFICDRGVSHELVRHRLCSFAQESTRYCDYSGEVTFIIPPWVDLKPGTYFRHDLIMFNDPASSSWFKAVATAEQFYQTLRKRNWSPQKARSVLPNSTKTEIIVSANLREWIHIFKLRCSSKAHPQMQELMIPLLKEIQGMIPVLYDDIKVN